MVQFGQFFVLALAALLNVCASDSPKITPGEFSPIKQAVAPTEKLPEVGDQFQAFKQKFNKKYGSVKEEQDRLRLFEQNLKTIERLKAEETGTAVYGVTEMADWSREEFLAQRASLKPVEMLELSKFMKKVNITELRDDAVPEAFDWRTGLFVSSVKDQKTCGSSWAFAPVGNIENLHAMKTGFLEDFSVQQLLDCSKKASGCHGGTLISGYLSILDLGGLVPENKYPYVGHHNTTSHCNSSTKDIDVKLKEFAVLQVSEQDMPGFIATKGSTANAINADRLQFYKSGVIVVPESACDPAALNHMVLVVGYGRDSTSGLDYWTVKNSWGRAWGEVGYFRVGRGNNTCGIANYFTAARLED